MNGPSHQHHWSAILRAQKGERVDMVTREVRRRPPPVVAEIMRRHRARAGLSQVQLAERVGVSASMVLKIEQGTRAPSPLLVGRMGRVLNSSFETEMISALMGRS